MTAFIENWVKTWANEDFSGYISLGIRIVISLALLILAIQVIRLLKRLVIKGLGKLKVEPGIASFIASICSILLYIILGFTVATSLGIDAASVVAVLGSAGVTIGLAVQGSLSNLAGGILLQIFRPFKVGDFIIEDNKGNQGVVKEIGLFYTQLEGMGGRIIYLPNGTLANNSLTNITPSAIRMLSVKFQISYDSDIKKASKIIKEIMKEEKHTLDNRTFEVYVTELQADGIELEGRCFVAIPDFLTAKSHILENVKLKFDEEGIDIPFPQITVHNSKDN